MAPYRTPAILLFLCQIGQTGAALLLPSMSADIIDKGVLANDHAFIISHGLMMLAVAAVQIVLAIGVAWLGARIASISAAACGRTFSRGCRISR